MFRHNLNQPNPMFTGPANMANLPNMNYPAVDKGGKGGVMPMLPGPHGGQCCVAPPVIHPTECCVVNTCSTVIVPHIHPVHTQFVNHEVIQHKHQFESTTGYQNVVQEVNEAPVPTPYGGVNPWGGGYGPLGGFGPHAGPYGGGFGPQAGPYGNVMGAYQGPGAGNVMGVNQGAYPSAIQPNASNQGPIFGAGKGK